MAHLSPETFVDLLDGTVPEAAEAHLADCTACRDQLAALRATWQATVDVEVPEPSPLFWDHLSARVHDAVAADVRAQDRWWRVDWSWRALGFVGAALATLVVAVFLRAPHASVRVAPPPAASVEQPRADRVPIEPLPALPDDESIGFVADLASSLDVDAALPELRLTTHGAADRALAELTGDERVELHRLLDEAMRSNAAL